MTINERLRRRFWFELGLAAISTFLLLLTLVSREWIEVVFRIDPDNHSGSFEWFIVAAFAAVTAAFSIAARIEWRRAAIAHG